MKKEAKVIGSGKFRIVNLPEVSIRKRLPHPTIFALIETASKLPEGKGIIVTPEMFGWNVRGSRYDFAAQLRIRLKALRAPLRVTQRGDVVYVLSSPENGDI